MIYSFFRKSNINTRSDVMKKRIFLAVLVMVGLFVVGCGEDDTTNPVQGTINQLLGKWQVLSGFSAKYMNFNSDNTFDFLYEKNFGVRTLRSGVYLVNGTQVIFDFQIYNITVHLDTLTLWEPGNVIMAVKSDTIPGADDWVTPLDTLRSFAAPISLAPDMAWHGGYLWFGNGYTSDYLYKIDTATGSAVDSLSTSSYAWSLEWSGDSLWVSSDGSDNIYRIDTITGNILTMSPDMGAWIKGIAWDGEDLWCGSGNARTIYRFNPESDVIIDTFYIDLGVGGMTYDGTYLYACFEGVLNKFSVFPEFEVVAAYRLPEHTIYGIAYDGEGYWVTAIYRDEYKIIKLDL